MPAVPNPFADDPIPDPQRLHSVADPLNPYAAPVSAVMPERPAIVGVWRDGPLLVMHRSAQLPERCIVTAEPTTQRHFETVRWVKPVDFGDRAMVVGFGILPSILRERNRFPLPALLGAILAWFAVMGVTFAVIQQSQLDGKAAEDAFGMGMIASCILTGLCFAPYIVLRMRNRFLQVANVDKHYIWLSGPSEAFLRTLPTWLAADGSG